MVKIEEGGMVCRGDCGKLETAGSEGRIRRAEDESAGPTRDLVQHPTLQWRSTIGLSRDVALSYYDDTRGFSGGNVAISDRNRAVGRNAVGGACGKPCQA